MEEKILESEVCDHGGLFFEAIGEDFSSIEKSKEIINADVLDAWFEPSPKVISDLMAYLPWAIRTSPPTHSEGLVKTISEVRGVRKSCVLPSSGSSSIMYLALPKLLNPGCKALILNPTYGEYEHILKKLLKADIHRFDLTRDNSYKINTEKLGKVLKEGEFDIFIIVNPNSPTGQYLSGDELKKIADTAPKSTLIWVDETYIEYTGSENSLEKYAQDSENLLVCKSMSKVYAMSGIRCAYMVAAEPTVSKLLLHSPPWSVSLIAQMAAVNALNDPDYYKACYRKTQEYKAELVEKLQKLDIKEVIMGAANYILCDFGDRNIPELLEKCRSKGLYLRNTENMGNHWAIGIVRIAVKSRSDNLRMVKIIEEALN